ncbi:MAG: TauD/TfdA family dioxygenase [Gammaproteobacteria bacterium]|nr:TauD/TfdA family dioxygenase [Gammaproteobacteria bacterium]MDE2263497.1 TauD/TfdA family dioxygenase [Gammaproteobacteria bacterium]
MNAVRAIRSIHWTPSALMLEWMDGNRAELASIWLRDNLTEDRDPGNGQRLIDVADLPAQPRIRRATLHGAAVRIEWEHEAGEAWFDLDWLATQTAAMAGARSVPRPRLWPQGRPLEATRDFAWAALGLARGDTGIQAGWLRRLVTEGLAFLSEVPAEPGAILAAMPLIGQVAETNYGLLFDVRAVPEPENLAYSDRGLGLHTDNPYREPVPGFQALHVLVAAPDGGESVFADGFALAEQLRAEDPAAFEVLARTPVPFGYRSQNAALNAERPLIQLSCRGEVVAVHYNSRSIQPLPLAAEAAERYYRAYRRFALLLREPRFLVRFMMRAGDLAVFDNQRILHGRTGFASARHPRHLQGCYLTRDSVCSRAALLAEAAR